MKISLINGSPKNRGSVSGTLLKTLENILLKTDIDKKIDISNFKISNSNIDRSQYDTISDSEILIFAFPLYIDSVPSHMIKWLSLFEDSFSSNDIRIFTIINCGFYEGFQSKNAISIMKNWTDKANLKWGQGLGVGGGPTFFFEKTIEQNIGKNLYNGLKILSTNILTGNDGENIYTTPNIPRFVYMLTSHHLWRRAIRTFGGKPKDLSKKL
ncbi:MAG: NAD(P)H-dependent oxidoreductase [Fusobacteriaceae bacterium]|jgi:hypothetical protein|nr:NAD(P)H-dependent oxidoreductase [Fusobacteriaceae bacterium]